MRSWLTLGALALTTSLGISYHEEHQAAHAAMAQKETPTAILPYYAPGETSPMVRDIHVIGELDPDRAAPVETEHGTQFAIPFYSVTQLAKPMAVAHAIAHAGLERRPMPRGLALSPDRHVPLELKLARQSAVENPIAVGAVIADTRHPESVVWIGTSGSIGELGDLHGDHTSSPELDDAVFAAFAGNGIDIIGDPVFVTHHHAVPAATSHERARLIAEIAAAIFCALALLSLIMTERKRPTKIKNDDRPIQSECGLPAMSFFQPIAEQSELDNKTSPAWVISAVSWFKNRR